MWSIMFKKCHLPFGKTSVLRKAIINIQERKGRFLIGEIMKEISELKKKAGK
jgi:hypothetical protein